MKKKNTLRRDEEQRTFHRGKSPKRFAFPMTLECSLIFFERKRERKKEKKHAKGKRKRRVQSF
jgi:hypothetical protein